jgi:hypothetical protein
MFKDGEIFYQWLTYEDQNGDAQFTGALACKVQVGDTTRTHVEQWNEPVNMSSDSDDV